MSDNNHLVVAFPPITTHTTKGRRQNALAFTNDGTPKHPKLSETETNSGAQKTRTLPMQSWTYIFTFFTNQELYTLRTVCRRWCDAIGVQKFFALSTTERLGSSFNTRGDQITLLAPPSTAFSILPWTSSPYASQIKCLNLSEDILECSSLIISQNTKGLVVVHEKSPLVNLQHLWVCGTLDILKTIAEAKLAHLESLSIQVDNDHHPSRLPSSAKLSSVVRLHLNGFENIPVKSLDDFILQSFPNLLHLTLDIDWIKDESATAFLCGGRLANRLESLAISIGNTNPQAVIDCLRDLSLGMPRLKSLSVNCFSHASQAAAHYYDNNEFGFDRQEHERLATTDPFLLLRRQRQLAVNDEHCDDQVEAETVAQIQSTTIETLSIFTRYPCKIPLSINMPKLCSLIANGIHFIETSQCTSLSSAIFTAPMKCLQIFMENAPSKSLEEIDLFCSSLGSSNSGAEPQPENEGTVAFAMTLPNVRTLSLHGLVQYDLSKISINAPSLVVLRLAILGKVNSNMSFDLHAPMLQSLDVHANWHIQRVVRRCIPNLPLLQKFKVSVLGGEHSAPNILAQRNLEAGELVDATKSVCTAKNIFVNDVVWMIAIGLGQIQFPLLTKLEVFGVIAESTIEQMLGRENRMPSLLKCTIESYVTPRMYSTRAVEILSPSLQYLNISCRQDQLPRFVFACVHPHLTDLTLKSKGQARSIHKTIGSSMMNQLPSLERLILYGLKLTTSFAIKSPTLLTLAMRRTSSHLPMKLVLVAPKLTRLVLSRQGTDVTVVKAKLPSLRILCLDIGDRTRLMDDLMSSVANPSLVALAIYRPLLSRYDVNTSVHLFEKNRNPRTNEAVENVNPTIERRILFLVANLLKACHSRNASLMYHHGV